MTLDDEIDGLLRTHCPLLILVTGEEDRALRMLQSVCERSGRSCVTWDIADGFHAENGQAQVAAADPLAALDSIDQAAGHVLFVLPDFHDLWADTAVKRKLRAVAQRCKQRAVSIVVTMPAGGVPPELRDLAVILELPRPGASQIHAVLTALSQTPGVRQNLSPHDEEKLVQAALGLTLAQARRVFAQAVVERGVLDATAIDIVAQQKKDLIRGCEALEFYAPAETLADVGGLDVLKLWLHQRERAFTREAQDYGLPAPRGLALIGIPGTGKSLAAKVIGSLWRLPVLRLDVGALLGGRTGEAEERTIRALHLAEAVSPCVLWIDEMEKALAHGGGDAGTSARIFGTILTWMQEKTAPCFVVGTANEVETLPPELLRRGRFDEIFFLDLPTSKERAEIVAVHLQRRKRSPQDFDIARLATEASGYAGAEIEQAIIDAMYAGFNDNREFTSDDIIASLRRQVPLSVSSHERIDTMRRWLTEGRAQSASHRESSFARQTVPMA